MKVSEYFQFSETEKDHLRAWATELETTELPQGKNRLRSQDGFCCLGIYCNMKNENGWVSTLFSASYQWSFVTYEKGCGGKLVRREVTTYFPRELSDELGLEAHHLQPVFVAMNDRWSYSFRRIAKEVRSLANKGCFGFRTRWRMRSRDFFFS